MKQILHIFLIFSTFSGFCQNGTPIVAGARGAAMGGTSVTFQDIQSAFGNQAGLAYLNSASFTAIAEQRFLLNDLKTVAIAGAVPTNSGVFGLTLGYFGFQDFNEQKLGLAYARKLFEGFSVGTQILLLNTHISEYGSKTNFSFELGMLTQLLPMLQLGVHVYSPLQVAIIDGENLPTVFKIGLAYLPSEKLTCTGEVEKDIDFPARVKFGFEYKLIEQVQLRTGVATNPTNLAFGVGYIFKNGLSLDIASVYHQILGFTPTVSISYQRKKT